MKNPSPEEAERMAEVRHASLIRKWLSGKKLAAEEKAEIAHLLPSHILAQGPSAPGARAAVRGALSTRKHAKYERKLPDYQPTYDTTERAMKRWIRRGKELGDLPPLDDAPRMAGWWRRCMDHVVPDKLLGFESPDLRATSGDAAAMVAPGDAGPPAPRDFSGVRSLDLAENVEALRYTHAINKHLLDEALAGTNENLASLRQKNFERSFELLRKAEDSLVDLQKKRGQLIDEQSVRNEISQVLESLRIMREDMPRRIMDELEKAIPRKFTRLFRLLEKFLTPAVEKVRLAEEEVFRNLETVDGPDKVRELLAA